MDRQVEVNVLSMIPLSALYTLVSQLGHCHQFLSPLKLKMGGLAACRKASFTSIQQQSIQHLAVRSKLRWVVVF
jgi:hypothetical protein